MPYRYSFKRKKHTAAKYIGRVLVVFLFVLIIGTVLVLDRQSRQQTARRTAASQYDWNAPELSRFNGEEGGAMPAKDNRWRWTSGREQSLPAKPAARHPWAGKPTPTPVGPVTKPVVTNKLPRRPEVAAIAPEQERRAEYAATVFGRFSLSPELRMSGALRAMGARVTLKGPNLEEIQNLFQRQAWLPLINLLAETDLAEYPDSYAVDRAAHKLLGLDVYIFLQTTMQTDPVASLALYTLNAGGDAEPVLESEDWLVHPDFKGFLHPWDIEERFGIIAYGPDVIECRQRMEQLNASYARDLELASARLGVGDLSYDLFDQQLSALRDRVAANVRAWVPASSIESPAPMTRIPLFLVPLSPPAVPAGRLPRRPAAAISTEASTELDIPLPLK